jgi:hypothetical protein
MMIAIFIVLGILVVVSGVATIVLAAHDGANPRPFYSGYDSRHPH